MKAYSGPQRQRLRRAIRRASSADRRGSAKKIIGNATLYRRQHGGAAAALRVDTVITDPSYGSIQDRREQQESLADARYGIPWDGEDTHKTIQRR